MEAAQGASLTPQRDGLWLAANAKARTSLRHFVKLAWPILNPGTPLIWGWYHDAICDHLEAVTRGDIEQIIINQPPGTGKTTICSICWPDWEWLQKPENRWIFAAYGTDLPTDDNLARRRLITSEWYQREMAPGWALTGDANVKSRFENDRRGFMRATSVGAGITGRHADRQVIDDPIKAQDIYGAQLAGHVKWYFQTFASRKRDGVRRVLVMQRLHTKDLAGALLATGEWEHLCLRAEYRPKFHCSTRIGWSEPRTEFGELLDPQRLPKSTLEAIRIGGDIAQPGLGTAMYEAQYQQDPVGDEGNMVHRDWWRFYSLDEEDASDDAPLLPERFDAFVGSWDMTFKASKTSDFVVGQVWGRVGATFYLLDQVRGRMGFVDTERAVLALASKWPECRRWLVEEAANGAAIIDRLKTQLPGIVPVRVRESKEARLQAVSSFIEAGQVRIPLPKDGRWVVGYIEELAAFPRGENDDQVDATSMALRDMSARALLVEMPEVRRISRRRAPATPFAAEMPEAREAEADRKRRAMHRKSRRGRKLAALAERAGGEN